MIRYHRSVKQQLTVIEELPDGILDSPSVCCNLSVQLHLLVLSEGHDRLTGFFL